MALKLLQVGLITLSTILSQTIIANNKNNKDTDYNYNGEEDPNFNVIDPSDWDNWCDRNSEYSRPENGYKNKYFIDKEQYNFGICPLVIDDAVVQLSSSFTDSTGFNHAMALTSNGDVYGWGSNAFGQLGAGGDASIPTKILGLTNIVAISASRQASLALDKYGRVWGWGHNEAGHGEIRQTTPKLIDGLTDIVSIKSKHYGFYALSSGGEIYSWGYNEDGETGDGTTDSVYTPVNISKTNGSLLNGVKIKSISEVRQGGRALDYAGNMYVWGSNFNGALGLGDTAPISSPVKVELENISKIYDLSQYSTVVKLNDGKIYGSGSITRSNYYKEITWAKNSKYFTYSDSSLFIDEQGHLIVSGINDEGQLGLGDTRDRSEPVVSNLINVMIAENNRKNSYTINSYGEVYSFGRNGYSVLGINIGAGKVRNAVLPVKMIRSKPAYMVSATGEVGANSNDNYKYIYTNEHPTKQIADNASPLKLTSKNINSSRYDSLSTITDDNYTTSDDYFTNTIGGEMCNEAGNCFEVPQIREPNEDANGPNFNPEHQDYSGGIPDEYELAHMKPVALTATESEQGGIDVPLFDGDRTNSQYIKIDKLGQMNDNLVVLMEVYSYDESGAEILIKSEKFDNKGVNKGNFIIAAQNYYKGYNEATFRFKTYLDIDINKDEANLIKYYSSTRTFTHTHTALPNTGSSQSNSTLLIIIIVIVIAVLILIRFFYKKSRRRPSRY